MKTILKALFLLIALSAVPVFAQTEQGWVAFEGNAGALNTILKEYDVKRPPIISQEFTLHKAL